MRSRILVGFTGCKRTMFFVFAKKASRLWKKGFAACCSARLVLRRTFTGREEFFPTRMSREKTDPILFCPLRRPKLYEVFGVPGGHTVFVSMPWGKRKGRSNDRRTNIAYQMHPCLVNPFPWIRTTSPGCPSCRQSFYTTSQLAKLTIPCYYIVRKGRQVINLKAQ